MTSLDAMKQVSALVNEGNYDGAYKHVLSLKEETLLSFTTPSKIKIIELLRSPDKDHAARALKNPEWFDVGKEALNTCLLKTLSDCKGQSSDSGETKDEKPEDGNKSKGGRRRRRGMKLSELDGAKSSVEEAPKPDPKLEDAVEAAESVEPAHVEVGEAALTPEAEVLETFVNNIQKENDDKFERFVRRQTEFSDQLTAVHEELVKGKVVDLPPSLTRTIDRIESAQEQTAAQMEKVLNAQTAIMKKIDRLMSAVTIIGMWTAEVSEKEFLTTVATLNDRDMD